MNKDDKENNIEIENNDDISFEEDTENTAPDYANKISKLKEKIKELEEKCSEYLLGWQKDKADFINLRRKDEEAKKGIVEFAKTNLITEILPVLDSFEMAMKNKEVWEKVDANWRVGVEYINTQLLGILESNGLKKINPLGEVFDPQRDEAMEMIEVKETEKDHKILEVIQSGYKIGDIIIRPAKVKVGEFKQ
jgi:molecular chaperone GrpE